MSAVLQWPRGRLDFSAGCLVMGILNVTPDSFSDGGQFLDPGRAVEHGLKMAADGAAVIDVGGESTRPGSKPVPPAEQIRRVVPVIGALAERIDIPISIDTTDVEVARAALLAGASILNDITALADERMAELAVQQQVPMILMHMQGTPATMQAEPHYDDVVAEVRDFLARPSRESGPARDSEGANLYRSRDWLRQDPGAQPAAPAESRQARRHGLPRAGGTQPQGLYRQDSQARTSPPTGSSGPRRPSRLRGGGGLHRPRARCGRDVRCGQGRDGPSRGPACRGERFSPLQTQGDLHDLVGSPDELQFAGP